jgi:hypothetical protein
MTALSGTPSDDVDAILATGRGGVTAMYLSMSTRHPDGDDAAYLAWHTLDHRPEQHRLEAIRASLRIVSTPACRTARAASHDDLDAVDHVMTYFFDGSAGFDGFLELSDALREAGRTPFVLPPVERGAYTVHTRRASPRVKVGADVLPWVPASGVYLLLETMKDGEGDATADDLVEVPGVAGAWTASATPPDDILSSAPAGQRLTYCFLDDDPVATAIRLRPVLERRWVGTRVTPLLAAPFHVIVPGEWDRYLP